MAVNSFNAQNPPVTTKGDVFTFSTIPTRLAVGANNTVLTADSTTATGLKWASPTSNASYTLINTGGTTLNGAATYTVSGISGYDSLLVLVTGAGANTALTGLRLRINSDSTSGNYSVFAGAALSPADPYSGNIIFGTNDTSTADAIPLADQSNATTSRVSAYVKIDGGNSTGFKSYLVGGAASGASAYSSYNRWISGIYKGSATISSITILTNNAANFAAGTLWIYGSAK